MSVAYRKDVRRALVDADWIVNEFFFVPELRSQTLMPSRASPTTRNGS